jgi:regulator of cell morphogenesis and NO signaling
MNSLFELTLSEIVRKHPSAATLFEKYDLDYCCHGKVPLQEACDGDIVKYHRIEHALHRLFEDVRELDFVHFERMNLENLINHIIAKHHHYVKESLPVIYARLDKVTTKHGLHHPELLKIFELFFEVKAEMEQHMFKEEQMLFPRIKIIAEAFRQKNSEEVNDSFLIVPINMMQVEHEKAGNALHQIREFTHDFHAPKSACTTHRLCYAELKEFERDLHQHVHLENNILFLKALEIQKELGNSMLNA